MHEQLEWLIHQRVLYAARSGQESLADLEAFTRQVDQRLAEEGQEPVHLIWDMTDLDVDGVDRREASTFLTQLMKHEKVKWFVVIDPEAPFLRRLLAVTLLRFNGIYWRAVDSRADGLAFLRRADPSLSTAT
jgi:hypothetical protein